MADMNPVSSNFGETRGRSWSLLEADGSPANLTSTTWAAYLTPARGGAQSSAVASASTASGITVTDAAGGIVEVTWPSASIEDIVPGVYWLTLSGNFPSGEGRQTWVAKWTVRGATDSDLS